MYIWLLDPIDVPNDAWAAGTYKGGAIIRAPSEDRAREMASQVLYVAATNIGAVEIKTTPWNKSELVQVKRLLNSCYSEDGPEAILVPGDKDND